MLGKFLSMLQLFLLLDPRKLIFTTTLSGISLETFLNDFVPLSVGLGSECWYFWMSWLDEFLTCNFIKVENQQGKEIVMKCIHLHAHHSRELLLYFFTAAHIARVTPVLCYSIELGNLGNLDSNKEVQPYRCLYKNYVSEL